MTACTHQLRGCMIHVDIFRPQLSTLPTGLNRGHNFQNKKWKTTYRIERIVLISESKPETSFENCT